MRMKYIYGTAQFYIQLVYKPHFGTWILLFGPFGQLRAVRKKKWILVFLSNFWGWFFQLFGVKKKLKLKAILCNFWMRTLKYVFPCWPKWPEQKNSCSKMWPINQLYIELGHDPSSVTPYLISHCWLLNKLWKQFVHSTL